MGGGQWPPPIVSLLAATGRGCAHRRRVRHVLPFDRVSSGGSWAAWISLNAMASTAAREPGRRVISMRCLARQAMPGPDQLARAGPGPVRDDHVRVPQLVPVGAVRRRDLGDAAVRIRPELPHELLEHVSAIETDETPGPSQSPRGSRFAPLRGSQGLAITAPRPVEGCADEHREQAGPGEVRPPHRRPPTRVVTRGRPTSVAACCPAAVSYRDDPARIPDRSHHD
jgi:hypothetical protein